VLGLGLGRAILFLRQYDARPYWDIILHACTHWTGYDQQAEARSGQGSGIGMDPSVSHFLAYNPGRRIFDEYQHC
jgi:hypothetical protein